jgi:hypothetical protein
MIKRNSFGYKYMSISVDRISHWSARSRRMIVLEEQTLNKEKALISMEAHNFDCWRTEVNSLSAWEMEEGLSWSIISATKASYGTGVQIWEYFVDRMKQVKVDREYMYITSIELVQDRRDWRTSVTYNNKGFLDQLNILSVFLGWSCTVTLDPTYVGICCSYSHSLSAVLMMCVTCKLESSHISLIGH